MQGHVFAVDHHAYCIWDPELNTKNLNFLNAIDPDFFLYLSQIHFNQITDEKNQCPSMALRMSYFHGLETFFSFIAASIQAPHAVIAYVTKAQPRDLKKVVSAITKNDSSLLCVLNLETISWEEISRLVNRFEISPNTPNPIPHFAKLWHYFAQDFVNEHHVSEYNSIKHGFRVSSGPTKVEFRPKNSSKYMELESGNFGTGFFIPEKIKGAPKGNLRLKRVALNWSPNTIAKRLNLLASSLHNVLSFLKILNGTPGEEVLFRVPDGLTDFEEAERNDGVILKNIRTTCGVSIDNIQPMTSEEMLDRLRHKSIDK